MEKNKSRIIVLFVVAVGIAYFILHKPAITPPAKPAQPIVVTSPNGAETWRMGTPHNIMWHVLPSVVATNVDILLSPFSVCPADTNCQQLPPYIIATGIDANLDSYTWVVGQGWIISYNGYGSNSGIHSKKAVTIPDGKYGITICETGTTHCALGNGLLTLVSSLQ